MRLAISDIKHNEKPISGGATTNTLEVKDVSLYDLVHYIENGCGFSNPFHNKKGKDNCDPTNLIIIDIDKVDSDIDYIQKIIKGIIYYPSFSDGLNNRHSYRVIVKVDKFINTRDEYRHYANILISMLNEKGIDVDVCCNQMDRLYYGTKYKCIVNDADYNYTLDELENMALFYEISEEPIKSISKSNKPLKSKENEVKSDFIKEFMRGVPFNILESEYSYNCPIIEQPFIDWGEDELCREISDYIEIKNRWRNGKIKKFGIGEGRKNIVLTRLSIKKIIKPDFTFEQLLMNGIFDINHYYDNSDNKLNNIWLYGTAKQVYDTDVEDLKKMLKKFIKTKLKMNMSKINEENKSWQSVRGDFIRNKNEEDILEIFDCNLKLKENYDIYIQAGNKLGYTSYRRICKSLNLDYKGKHK